MIIKKKKFRVSMGDIVLMLLALKPLPRKLGEIQVAKLSNTCQLTAI